MNSEFDDEYYQSWKHLLDKSNAHEKNKITKTPVHRMDVIEYTYKKKL